MQVQDFLQALEAGQVELQVAPRGLLFEGQLSEHDPTAELDMVSTENEGTVLVFDRANGGRLVGAVIWNRSLDRLCMAEAVLPEVAQDWLASEARALLLSEMQSKDLVFRLLHPAIALGRFGLTDGLVAGVDLSGLLAQLEEQGVTE